MRTEDAQTGLSQIVGPAQRLRTLGRALNDIENVAEV